MRVGPATNVARINVTETITALWTFAHANGISLDDMIERTVGAGVTIDGVKLKDGAVSVPGLPAAGNIAIESAVLGDAEFRYRRQADGTMLWGDGALAPDTNLYRSAADVLKTDDSFHVAAVLKALGDAEISERDITLGIGDNDDLDIGSAVLQRLTPNVGNSTITGLAGARARRIVGLHKKRKTTKNNSNKKTRSGCTCRTYRGPQ